MKSYIKHVNFIMNIYSTYKFDNKNVVKSYAHM